MFKENILEIFTSTRNLSVGFQYFFFTAARSGLMVVLQDKWEVNEKYEDSSSEDYKYTYCENPSLS